jgi:hypothetical protein
MLAYLEAIFYLAFGSMTRRSEFLNFLPDIKPTSSVIMRMGFTRQQKLPTTLFPS